jgi:hypothetical protein
VPRRTGLPGGEAGEGGGRIPPRGSGQFGGGIDPAEALRLLEASVPEASEEVGGEEEAVFVQGASPGTNADREGYAIELEISTPLSQEAEDHERLEEGGGGDSVGGNAMYGDAIAGTPVYGEIGRAHV